MFKKISCLFLVLSMCFGTMPAWAEEIKTFLDVPKEHVAYEAVMNLTEKGVIDGKSDTEFCPDDNITREEYAKVLSKAFSLTSKSGATLFYDVPAGMWCGDYVQLVSASKMMTGISADKFGVGLNLSRQDMALILKRFADKEEIKLVEKENVLYADDAEISDYARDAVVSLRNAGIISKRDDNLWEPKAPATRAEVAIALDKIVEAQTETLLAKGRWATPSIYRLQTKVPTDDRLAEAMPKPFDPTTMPTLEIAYEDFEDDEFGVLEKGTAASGGGIVDDQAYEGKRSLKTVAGSAATMTWKAPKGMIGPGDWLMLSCMAKSKGIEGGSGGRVRMSINDGVTGKWKTEGNDRALRGDTDWEKHTVLVMVPIELNALTRSDSYSITFQVDALNGTTAGEVWGDNFTLSKVLFHPMDTVLMSPAYKGIIKGENGVGDIALRAYVSEENGGYDFDKMRFTAQITDDDHKVYMKSESDKVTSQMDVYFSSKDLPMGGDYYLESILTDTETGEVIQKEEWPLHKKEADFTTVLGYDEHGRITKHGEPVILVTVMGGTRYDDILEELMKAGCFDGISATGLGWHWSFGANNEEMINTRKVIAEAAERGMGIGIGGVHMAENDDFFVEWTDIFDKTPDSTTIDIRRALEQVARNYHDLPGMLLYYTSDEENSLQWGHQLSWNRKIIESIDLDHPTYSAVDNPLKNRPGVAAKTSDFLGFDPYPVTGQPNQRIEMVYERIIDGSTLNPGRPIVLIGQMFWWRGNKEYIRIPTQTEYRNMVFQALIAGADGIDNYQYRALQNNPGEAGWETKWKEVCEVLSEVKHLEPVFLSLEPAPYYEVYGGGEWLKHKTYRHDGKSYLVTVNTDPNKKSAQVRLEGVDVIRSMYTGEEIEANSDGTFEIKWSGYGTDVFEFDQADYKSHHAELNRFALVDTILTGAEEEESSFYVKAGTKEVTYRATISDKAQFYINGEIRETTGTLDISTMKEINVKVLSEDGRFVTEKTYSIQEVK